MDEYISFISKSEESLFNTSKKITEKIHDNGSDEDITKIIQENIENLDEAESKIQNIVSLVRMHSKELHKGIKEIIEKYYDSTTDSISQFRNLNKINLEDKKRKIFINIENKRDIFFNKLFYFIETYHPKWTEIE